ncbi:hypothetical protein Q2T76_03720 [Lactobacillus sp. YT155]|uniref:hypothetical protein n=1 Tax=Lactobacillus sp. YT155 TaxID=3060955 RepID=UPI00265DC184|nr:hypothetical protein [Lactobacillus sp. YT155]MDO1605162.1 hypothetical protein [Lactobacillus sp. YT155]
MSLSLTLGSKNALTNFDQTFLLLKPVNSDENYLRISQTEDGYEEIYNQQFNWHAQYFRLIYLEFNEDQAAIFESMLDTDSQLFDKKIVIKNEHSYVIIISDDSKKATSYQDIKVALKQNTTKDFGMFSKLYELID